MTTVTWIASGGGDWANSGNWSPATVPNASDATAIIPDGTSGYVVTIAAGESEVVNAITLGNTVSGSHPTLDVAGTLTFAGTAAGVPTLFGELQTEPGGVLDGAGNIGGHHAVTASFINDGTLIGDGGTGSLLAILIGFTNNGTVLANSGLVGLEGKAGVTNLSGGTLTGGTWIAQGPSIGTLNQIELGFNFDAVISVDAATIVLDGVASDIEGYSGPTLIAANFQPIEQQLQTIAPSGTLQLLDARGYQTSNTISDQGILSLAGGTLATTGVSITAGGTLAGFGVVAGGVANQGAIIASGGSLALDITTNVSGTGNLTVTPGSTLVLSGGAPSQVANNGLLYDAGGLLNIGSLSGAGRLVVQANATLELGAAAQAISFSGSNATLKLDNFAAYTGTLTGFAQGDTLELVGATATGALVSGGSLVVMNNASTIDTIALAGSYAPGAKFSVSSAGGNAFIVNTSGAPLRQDFAFTVLPVNDTAGLSATEEAEIVNDLSAAAQDWAQYLTGHTTLRIQLNIEAGTNGAQLASAGATTNISNGTTLDGRLLDTPSSLTALNTGNYALSTNSDITVNFLAGNLGSIYVNPNPTPMSSGSVPSGQFDLVTVFRHELAHGFGFGGLTTSTGTIGAQETLFDHYIGTVGGTIVFTGPQAEAEYGVLLGTTATPVPLTDLPGNGEDFAHFANSTLDVNATDLMSGLGLPPAAQRDISAMDLAVLQDIGAPVTATPGAVCFARGTRIATPQGDVPIERLNVDDDVLALSGRRQVIWIGRRRIDCRRHPDPRKVWPVRIRAHAFGDHLPRRELLVSPQHALFLNGVLIPAHCLIDGGSVVQVPVDSIVYFHIELPQHDVVFAEGLPAESYLDAGDRTFFDDGRLVTLHPDFATRVWEANACAPLTMTGPEVDAARRRLSASSPSRVRLAASR